MNNTVDSFEFVVDGYPIALSPLLLSVVAALVHSFFGASKSRTILKDLENLIKTNDWQQLQAKFDNCVQGKMVSADLFGTEQFLVSYLKVVALLLAESSPKSVDTSAQSETMVVERQTSDCSLCSRLSGVPSEKLLEELHGRHRTLTRAHIYIYLLTWTSLGALASTLFFALK